MGWLSLGVERRISFLLLFVHCVCLEVELGGVDTVVAHGGGGRNHCLSRLAKVVLAWIHALHRDVWLLEHLLFSLTFAG